MQEIYDFLKKCGTYYLATTAGDQPHVRPFGTIELFEGRLYIQTGRSKNVAKQLFENPKAEICAFDGERWVRITTTLHADDRLEAKKHMLAAYPELQQMYSAEDPLTLVLFMKDTTATIYGIDGITQTIRF
ncbi:MAG: pyridoxamine 5'-phosphate oxidase family protein [Prevotellaceae bacterium]|nr:pyridoxamine 5'-phosphate oxidase family protein [Prevotellaceae bacterium]